MIYTAAQREDGTPVPVWEEYRTGDRIEVRPGVLRYEEATRPVSWALILPGDEVMAPDGSRGYVALLDLGSTWPITVTDSADGSSDLGDFNPHMITLVCTDEIPEHRRGNPAWQWPTP